MLTLRPLSGSFALSYAHDPAFEIGRDGYDDEYKRCTETLDFAPITIAGQSPTRFVFRALKTSELNRFSSLGVTGVVEIMWLTFRLCLERVEDGGGDLAKIERVVDAEYPQLGAIVSPAQMDLMDRISMAYGKERGDLVISLGSLVFKRSRSPSVF